MRINHNLTAMNTHRQLGVTASSQAKSMERLSSGYRINRAGDDAAGLAISEKMRAQIRGLNQASRNAQDGISMIQTFEGGLNETHSILQRMRELAVQSANDVNTDSDRLQINNEIGQLKLEVDRIANNTEFNTMNMMNYGATLNAAGFSDVSQAVVNSLNIKIPEWINDSMVAINTRFGIDYPDSPVLRDMAIVYVDDPTAGYAATMATSDAGQSLTLTINLDSFTDASGDLVDEQLLDGLLAHEVMHAFQYTEMSQLLGGGLSDEETWFVEGLSMLVQGGNSWVSSIPGGLVGADISGTFGNTQEEYASAFVALKTLHEITVGGIGAIIDQLEDGTSSLNDAIAATAQTDQGEASGSTVANYTTFGEFIAAFNAGNFDDYFTNSGTTDFTLGTGAITDAATAGSSSNLSLADTIPNNTGIDKVYAHFDLSFATGSGATTADNTTDEVVLQIGANQGQTMAVAAFDATSNGLGIGSVNVATQLSSDRAITTLDTAIKTVSSIRARLGAVQNRLEHTISNLDNTSENLQGAESRIRDVDMAKEMMAFTKYNILQQAGQSMLAQANQRPQMILALLQA